jgi:hypothetical protein
MPISEQAWLDALNEIRGRLDKLEHGHGLLREILEKIHPAEHPAPAEPAAPTA